MKANKLDCCIVRDLLPSYIEGLTEPETTEQVSAHLDECAACKQLEHDMRTQIPAEPVPKKSLRFLKKVQRTRLLAAVLAALVTILCAWMLYDSRFHYANTESGRMAAVEDVACDERLSEYAIKEGSPIHVTAYLEKDDFLYIAFAADNSSNSHGIMQLLRGINGKYRILSCAYSSFPYSAGVMFDEISYIREVSDNTYTGSQNLNFIVFSGFNCGDIAAFHFRYSYENPITSENGFVEKTYPVPDSDFLIVWSNEELLKDFGLSGDPENTWLTPSSKVTFLDENGTDITEQYKISVSPSGGAHIDFDDMRLTYVLIGSIVLIGVLVILHIFRRDT
ncbi:zf-HC2 domain-containing protein [Butyricicoccus porcorum]|uniref:Putative zinc-finger domain-containing protein n=1 Tax=Butyricicoccus porcorum TaxID=1945634 RepID=A0A252F405_9FIRM|nr:zf-HC2 domain-containing protein [Butyricicoccus porcorum]OUM20462.1 hypothetical protein CBW42_06415 [Butyricicoccus porcorum]